MTTVPNQYGFGALFDLDGVIIDSETLYTGFWNDIEAEFPTGIPDYAIAIKGRTLESIMEEYPTEEIRREITRRLMDFQASMRFTPLPGAVEMLEALAAAGVPSALVTSSDAVKMR
ncbi:MAG: HAD hydrolase-like protein, partial [Paramuribaculum sp.]|nr:HAD hydrolase-like protein [Paramuribaculum sp.]